MTSIVSISFFFLYFYLALFVVIQMVQQSMQGSGGSGHLAVLAGLHLDSSTDIGAQLVEFMASRAIQSRAINISRGNVHLLASVCKKRGFILHTTSNSSNLFTQKKKSS